jgi:hypothetical protein
MSSSYRDDQSKGRLIIAAVGSAILLVVGLGAILFGLSKQAEYERTSYERSAEYAAYTYGPAYNACIRLPPPDQKDCIAKAKQEWSENTRGERDLVAQQVMSVWTFLMGCAAIVGMILSAVGVALVYSTFQETKRTADAAIDASEATAESNRLAKVSFKAGFRPWLLVKVSGVFISNELLNMFGDGDGLLRSVTMRARIEVTNYGDMPATIIASDVGVSGESAGLHIDRPQRQADLFDVLTNGQTFVPLTFGADNGDDVSVGIFALTRENRGEFMMARPPIVGVIDYLDALGKPRQLGFAFQPTAMWGSDYKRWGGAEYNYDREMPE